MKTSEFDYELPQELIAQTPLKDRTASRMLVVHKNKGTFEHRHFSDITEYFHAGDVLVRNNTRVIPARLFGTKEITGAHVEVLLLKQLENDVWECLVGNAKTVKMGTVVSFHDGRLRAECVGIGDKGIRQMKMLYNGIFNEILDELGNVPCPLTSRKSWMTRSVTRQSTRRSKAVRLLRPQDCTLRMRHSRS